MTDRMGGINDRRSAVTPRQAVTLGAAMMLALATSGLASTMVNAQTTLLATAGIGDGTVAGQAFKPGDITVAVGDSVTFSIASDDPHTITFGSGPADVPPPLWPTAGFEAPDPASPPPYDLGTASYDGTGFINTGILFGKTSSATIEFTAPGSFPFICLIHPGMAGQVTVVEEGPTTTQDEADAAIAATDALLLGQVDSVREDRLASTSTTENEDGTTTWNIFADAGTEAGPMPGGGSGFLELTEFLPMQIEISAGDTISWTADRIHTVTFVPDGMDAEEVFPSEEAAFAPIGGDTYDGTEVVNSGAFNFPLDPSVPPVTEYSLTFPEPGTYPYFCAIHAVLGQVGVVIVT